MILTDWQLCAIAYSKNGNARYLYIKRSDENEVED
jgi:uncharacterized protein YcgL (UPF0745 family)